MSLAEKLDAIREASGKRIPAEKRVVMGQATADLRESGILNRVAKPGDRMPEFSLRNAYGVEVHSADLLAEGPVVLSVFRGTW